MKIIIREKFQAIYMIEADAEAAMAVKSTNESEMGEFLMDHVRDITDWHSCVLKSPDGESAVHDFDGAEHFVLVMINDEMLRECPRAMGAAVDNLVNDMVEYLKEQGFAPVPA